MRTGPPAPISIRATRRKIRARIIRSPSSASAIIRARKRSVGMIRASTSEAACTSTRDGRPERSPTSAMKSPAPISTIGDVCPGLSRRATVAAPEIRTIIPGLGRPADMSCDLPVKRRTAPKPRNRSISADVSLGNICSRRVSINDMARSDRGTRRRPISWFAFEVGTAILSSASRASRKIVASAMCGADEDKRLRRHP